MSNNEENTPPTDLKYIMLPYNRQEHSTVWTLFRSYFKHDRAYFKSGVNLKCSSCCPLSKIRYFLLKYTENYRSLYYQVFSNYGLDKCFKMTALEHLIQ